MGAVQTRMVVAFETFGTSNENLGLTASGQIAPVPTSGDTAGEGCPRLPLMSRRAMSKIVTNKGRLETVNVQVGTVTAANNFDYSFKVRQVVNGLVRIVSFFYTSDATGSQAEVVTAVINTFNAQNAQGGIFVTATGSTSITLTGQAGYPLFDVFDVSGNLSFASGMATYTGQNAAGSVLNVVGSPVKVTFTASHGLLTGDTVSFLASWTGSGSGALLNGVTSRVTYVSATEITVDSVLATGTAKAVDGTAVKVAQAAYGTSTQVDADFASNGQSYTAAATGLYDSYDIVVEGDTNVFTGRIWCNANLKASPSTPTANYSAFTGDIIGFTTATVVGSTITIAKMFGLPTV
jgi:hypothetical protein